MPIESNGAASPPASCSAWSWQRETDRALDHVRRREAALGEGQERSLRAWQSLCRAVLAANEFLYVE